MADQRSSRGIYGLAKPEPVPRGIFAGDFHFLIADGTLREITCHGVEIVRGLDCPVRDQNWGTYSQTEVEENFSETDGRFDYHRKFKIGDEQLSGTLTITVEPDGPLIVRLVLRAIADFTTNRAGFTLLHPITDVAGQTLTVTHADGTEDVGTFPQMIAPAQPVFDIRRLRHRVGDTDVLIEFTGEIFEMEDQRNWSDASYKTYCRPLRLPIPYVIKAGETVTQKIRITASAASGAARSRSAPATEPVRFEVSDNGTVGPDILLAAGSDWIPQTDPWEDKIAGVQGIVARLEEHETGKEVWVRFLERLTNRSSAYCDLEIVVPDGADPTEHLTLVAANFSNQGLLPRHVFALPAAYMRSYQPNSDWPQGPSPEDCAQAAEIAFPDAEIGVGMATNFTEVNRCRQTPDAGRYLTFSTTAIVHAADDRSVMETLEALPHIFATAKSFSGGRTLRLGLMSIGMRTNPYGAGVVPNPNCERLAMAMDDPRQHGLFAASFAVAACASAAQADCRALALAAPAGPFSMTTGDEQPEPSPLFHVTSGLARLAGKPLLHLKNLPSGVHGISVQGTGGVEGLCTNAAFTPAELIFDQPVTAVPLDQHSSPATWSPPWRLQEPPFTTKSLTLGPCETVFFASKQIR